MLGILFFLLGVAATKLMLWQTGLFAGMFGMSKPEDDYAIIGLSLLAALIFFGLWYAGRVNKGEAKANVLFD